MYLWTRMPTSMLVFNKNWKKKIEDMNVVFVRYSCMSCTFIKSTDWFMTSAI